MSTVRIYSYLKSAFKKCVCSPTTYEKWPRRRPHNIRNVKIIYIFYLKPFKRV